MHAKTSPKIVVKAEKAPRTSQNSITSNGKKLVAVKSNTKLKTSENPTAKRAPIKKI